MGRSTVMLSTFVYGLPTSLPGQGQHIVARHRWEGRHQRPKNGSRGSTTCGPSGGYDVANAYTFAPLSVNSAKHLDAYRGTHYAALRVTRRGRPRPLESWTCVLG